jgi:hypothetical protein
MTRSRLLHIILIIITILAFSSNVSAITDSTDVSVVQVSGLVVTGDSLFPLPYATVYRIRDQRGTTTDVNGFFSIPALEGDTLQFSSTGYLSRTVIIPDGGERNRVSIVQAMSHDTVMVNQAFVYPWPSRDRFKQEFMALGLDENEFSPGNMAADPFEIYDRLVDIGLDGQASATEQLRQISIQQDNQSHGQTNNLLNPVAWAKFIQALRNGDLKKD